MDKPKRGQFSMKQMAERMQIYASSVNNPSIRGMARFLVDNYPEDYLKGKNAADRNKIEDSIRGTIYKFIKDTPSQTIKHKADKLQLNEVFSELYRKKALLSVSELVDDYILPKACDRLLILPDMHYPFVNWKAFDRAIDYGIRRSANGILLLGDQIDMYKGSKFRQKDEMPDLHEEMEGMRLVLQTLRKTFPSASIFYKIGNHDERWEQIIREKHLNVFQEFRLNTILRFAEYGVQEIQSKQLAYSGKLALAHGHEFPSGQNSPIGIARSIGLKTQAPIAIGHHHKSNTFSFKKQLTNESYETYSLGCLSNINPDYARFNQWNHGFGYQEIYDVQTGDFDFMNLLITPEGRIRAV